MKTAVGEVADPRAGRSARGRVYQIYGLRLKSAIPLACSQSASPESACVEVRRGTATLFSRVRRQAGVGRGREPWFRHVRLPDGGDYLRWARLFEFSVSADGSTIDARALDGASNEAFRTYLLGQVLSFALVRREVEPLHSTAAVVDGGAVAFLGDCGHGKSTLGAAFLHAGCRLLTDDLLVLSEGTRAVLAHPGPPRIKLFPRVADRLLGESSRGGPMNTITSKRVIPLTRERACAAPVPLRAIFVLGVPGRSGSDRIVARRLSARRACVELIRNTFNAMVADPPRLERQLSLAARLAARVPVFSLSYPRRLSRLPAVVEEIRRRAAASPRPT